MENPCKGTGEGGLGGEPAFVTDVCVSSDTVLRRNRPGMTESVLVDLGKNKSQYTESAFSIRPTKFRRKRNALSATFTVK